MSAATAASTLTSDTSKFEMFQCLVTFDRIQYYWHIFLQFGYVWFNIKTYLLLTTIANTVKIF